MNETKQLQREVRRNEAIWHMYTRLSWTMHEIAEIFKMTRQNVKYTLEREAAFRKDELEKYYK